MSISLARVGNQRCTSGAFRHSAVLHAMLLALLALVACSVCNGAPLKINQLDHVAWTAREGAPTQISALAMDPDGSLWVLATSGLYNFDGFRFTPFSFSPSSEHVSFSSIRAIAVGRDGCLWVGSSIAGIARACKRHIEKLYDDSSGLSSGAVSQLIQSPDGEMMALVKNQLMVLSGGRWQNVVGLSALQGEPIRQVFFDREGHMLLLTNAAVWYRSNAGQRLIRSAAAGGYWGSFAEQPDGSLWVLTNSRGPHPAIIQRVHLDDSAHTASEKFAIPATQLAQGTVGSLWIAADAGLARWTLGATPDLYTHLDGLTPGTVNTVLKDATGTVWAGTDSGLDRFKTPRLVRVLGPGSHFPALSVCPTGEVWVAGEGPVQSIQDDVVHTHGPARNSEAIYCDHEGVVWLVADEGFWRYQGDAVQKVSPPAGIDPIELHSIVGENSRHLFVSILRHGLWNYEDGRWSAVSAPGFPDATPFSLLEDHNGRLWAGETDDRIAVLEGGRGHVFAAGDKVPLGEVKVFLESRVGLIAGGARGLALLREGRFHSLLAEDTEAVAGISGLLEAANGDLWLNGLHGIARIPKQELDAAVASQAHRMHSQLLNEAGIDGPSNQLSNLPSAVANSSGRLWFATSFSVVSVDPTSIKPSAQLPKLGRFSITVDGQAVAANFRISPGSHTVRIGYLGIFLNAPQEVIYRYRLQGFDQTWQDVGSRAEAVYTGLAPGHYTFVVEASNGEGGWTQADASQQFVVLRPFYRTGWFLCVGILIGCFIIWGLVRLRLMQIAFAIKKQADARADERIGIARDLHDTLLQGIQGLILRFHAAAQEVKSDARAHEQLVDALKSADTLLVEARNRVSGLRERGFDEVDLLDGYKKIGAALNEDKSVVFSVELQGTEVSLPLGVRQELYFIGREAITNAFRHASASTIRVLIHFARRTLEIAIRDDGCGFHNKTVGGQVGHWGLAGMMERAHRLGARFECCTEPGAGTVIAVSVPLPRRRLFRRFGALRSGRND